MWATWLPLIQNFNEFYHCIQVIKRELSGKLQEVQKMFEAGIV